MEMMLARVESQDLTKRLEDLAKGSSATDAVMKDKLAKLLQDAPGGASNPELEEIRKQKLDEQLDTKIQNAFEQLRGDNLFIWKQSLELAQKEFTEKGVGQTMNMLPKTILDRGDLKRTVNSLILEDNSVPNPQVIPS